MPYVHVVLSFVIICTSTAKHILSKLNSVKLH
jgi:hypothetical protein